MKKQLNLIILLMVFSVFAYGDIQFISPASGTSLTVGTNYQIQWSGPASEASQTVTVYMSMNVPGGPEIQVVSDTYTKGQGGFMWEVGRLKNGAIWKWSGSYKIWLESDDGDSPEHTINLIPQPFGMDHPVAGETLTIGTNYQVQWHGPTYEAYQTVAFFLEKVNDSSWIRLVNNSHTKGDGGFLWEVGRMNDGTFASPGSYLVSLESDDGDWFGWAINLVAPSASQGGGNLQEVFKKISQLKIQYQPGVCIYCFKLDLIRLKRLLRNIKRPYELQLFHNNRPVSKLGKFGRRYQLPNTANLKLNKKLTQILKKRGQAYFQLMVLTLKGKKVYKQRVLLKMTKSRIDIKRMKKR